MLWKFIFYCGSVVGFTCFSCEIGQRVTNLFEEIADRFNLLSWYLFPLKVQQLLPTIMINMDETIVIGCFGMLDGSRDQLKKVKSNKNVPHVNVCVLSLSVITCTCVRKSHALRHLAISSRLCGGSLQAF